MSDALTPPPFVAGFTGLGEIGRGGFSTVYRAVETDLGRDVALKVLSATGDDAGRVEREARALGSLSGVPHVVQVYRVTAAADGRPVLVMALMADSLGRVIRSGAAVPPEQSAAWLRQVAVGLDAAHARGIAHRDVKPDNVLLSADGDAHLADFGLAGLAELETGSTTAMSFSPPYAPPERFVGDEPDPAAGDRYSLAATWFAVLTGAAPFGTATDGGVHGLINRVVHDEVRDVAGMPPALRDVFERGLAKDPADRYATAAGFAHDYAAAVAGLGDHDMTVVRAAPLVLGTAAGAITSDRVDDGVTTSGRTRALLSAAAALIVLGLGALLVTVAGGHDDTSTTLSAPAAEVLAETTTSMASASTTVASTETTAAPGTAIPGDPAAAPPPEGAPGAAPPPPGSPLPGAVAPSPTPSPGVPSPSPVATPAPGAPPAPTIVVGPAVTAPRPPAPPPTTAPPRPGNCTASTGSVQLVPGIQFGFESSQSATLRIELACDAGPGTANITGFFPNIGFLGGSTSATGTVTWPGRGATTSLNGSITVDSALNVTFDLFASSGYGAPANLRFTTFASYDAQPVITNVTLAGGSFGWP